MSEHRRIKSGFRHRLHFDGCVLPCFVCVSVTACGVIEKLTSFWPNNRSLTHSLHSGFIQFVESRVIWNSRFPGRESHGIRPGSWKVMENYLESHGKWTAVHSEATTRCANFLTHQNLLVSRAPPGLTGGASGYFAKLTLEYTILERCGKHVVGMFCTNPLYLTPICVVGREHVNWMVSCVLCCSHTALVNEPFKTGKCRCIIKDVACLVW